MKLFKYLNIDVKKLVLIILIPILTLLISLVAWLSYHQMYGTILDGFNQKLIAISTTTGSFIDGDEHEKLAEAKEVKALAYGEDETLYGLDRLNQFLLIDLEKGGAKTLFKVNDEINDFTYNPESKLVYATQANDIMSIDPTTGDVELFYTALVPLQGIAYDSLKKIIYVSSQKDILQLNENKEFSKLLENKYVISSLSYEQNVLYAIEGRSDNLISIGTEDLKRTELAYKDFPVKSTSLSAIEVHKGKLYAGNHHLLIHDIASNSSLYEDFSRGYRDEKSKLYEKYIVPMTAIKIETGLTYHYTQNLLYNNEDANTVYILDVHAGNEYTPIGSEDEMDKESLLGAENVMLRKKVYVSKIKKWEQWGLLKVSFAPILNKEGVVKAIAGADIDMGIIREKTKIALIASIAVGIISLIISIIAAFIISQKIIEPIRKLKYSALRIAAGRYGDKVFVQNPKELSELSSTFNTMDEKIKDTISNLTQYNKDILMQRREQDLQRNLDQRLKIRDKQIRAYLTDSSESLDGFLLHENIFYFWFSHEKQEDRLQVSKERELISTTLRLLISNSEDPLCELKSIFKTMNCFGYANIEKNTIRLHEKSEELSLLSNVDDDAYRVITLSKEEMPITHTLIFAQPSTLGELTQKQIDFLVDEKYSRIKLTHGGLLIALLPKGESCNS